MESRLAGPFVRRTRCRGVFRGAAAVGASFVVLMMPAVVRAADRDAIELDRLLATLEDGRRLPSKAMGVAASARSRGPESRRLASFRARVEGRHDAVSRELAAVSLRPLPAKAAARLARARAAHEAGQGRLLKLLRAIEAASDGRSAGQISELAREARQALGEIDLASRQEPLSAELKVRAPSLGSLPLPAATGATMGSEASLGVIPAAVRALGTSLAGPIEAYAWVRNNVRTEFYYGSLKGPEQTLLDRSGNDADTAGLLIALLRAQGVPARFSQGIAVVDAVRLQAVTGTASPEQAVRVLVRAGVPHEPVVGGSGLAAVKLARVWAEAYVPYANYRGLPADAQGKLWVPLDPAFKDLRRPAGLDLVAELGLDPAALADEYLAELRAQSPREFLRERVGALLAPTQMTYEQALNDRSLVEEEALGILPNVLPYAISGLNDVSYDAPLAHELRVVGERDGRALIDARFSLPEILGKRLTLSYVPFSADDDEVVSQFGGLTRTPPYLFEVKPVLKLGGVVVAAGQAPVGMAVKYDLRLTLTFPGGHEEVLNKVLAGNLTAIALAEGEAAAADAPEPNAAALLARAGANYLRDWNRSDTELANVFRVVPVRPTASACFVMSDIDVEYAGGDPLYPVRFDWKGVAIDADLRASSPAGIEDRVQEPRFTLFSGLEGSILENRVFEDLWMVPSVSTAKALEIARGQGVEVLTLTRDNVDDLLPPLPLDELAKEEIREAALRGFLVRVPVQPVSFLAWTGVGWWILDEVTGESAWQLQGGHSGGVTAAAVIDWPDSALRDTLIVQDEDPAPDNSEVAKIRKFLSTDFQDGVVDKPLAKPFRVLVTDKNGARIPNAMVTFKVLGGQGSLMDPATGRVAGPYLGVLSNDRGEAEATLVLGKKTSEIPRFACLRPDPESCSADAEIYATQVGLNLVVASSGLAALDEPFTSYARPDDRFDGQFIYAYLSFKTFPQQSGRIWNKAVAGLVAINTLDQHGNPISNFRVRFAYKAPPDVLEAPPGWSRARRGGTNTQARLLKLKDYVLCLEQNPSPSLGDCGGEEPVLFVPSSNYGSVSYPVLGDSQYSRYHFDIGTVEEPDLGSLSIATWGWFCTDATAWWCKWPKIMVNVESRPVLVGATGDLIEAYPPGQTGELAYGAHALYEGYDIYVTEDKDGKKHYTAEGNNKWERKTLDDTVLNLTPRSPGTGVQPSQAAHVGPGKYVAQMTMAATPQLNIVDYEARSTPLIVPQDLPDHPSEVAPWAIIDPSANPIKIKDTRDPDRPWINQGASSLWGVKAEITNIDAAPIFLRAASTVAADVRVEHKIEPAAYRQLLIPTDVLFTLNRGDRAILAASEPSEGGPFTIPSGTPLQEGSYSAQLKILGVSKGGASISAEPVPIQAGIVRLTLDFNNDTVVDEKDDTAVADDANKAFSFWESNPAWWKDYQTVDALVDYATVRIQLPFTLPANQSLALTMVGSNWLLRNKYASNAPCKDGSASLGRAYLCNEGVMYAQATSVASEQGQPVPGAPGQSDQFVVASGALRPGNNDFLFQCKTRTDGSRGCVADTMYLSRLVSDFGVRVTIADTKRVDIRPFQELIGAHTVRGAGSYDPTGAVNSVPGWKRPPEELPPGEREGKVKPKTITVLVHGFKVTEAVALTSFLPTLAKRLYWAQMPILEAQDSAYLTGFTWPGDQAGAIIPNNFFYPEDEFNALRSGIPVARWLNSLADGSPGRTVNVIAHSLGNMVINNALKEFGGSPRGPITYIMLEPAVAAEAFDGTDAGFATELADHSVAYGFPDDARWCGEWARITGDPRDALPCPPGTVTSPPYSGLPLRFWKDTVLGMGPDVIPPARYENRWSRFQPGDRSAWRGFFANNKNVPNVTVFNFYSPTDWILRSDLGRGPLTNPHAWFTCQRYQKPSTGTADNVQEYLFTPTDGWRDDVATQFWGSLGGVSVATNFARNEYLWPGGNHSSILRQWAELAFYFPALSGAAGAQTLLSVGDRNVSMGDYSGIDYEKDDSKRKNSHSYFWVNTPADTWPVYKILKSKLVP